MLRHVISIIISLTLLPLSALGGRFDDVSTFDFFQESMVFDSSVEACQTNGLGSSIETSATTLCEISLKTEVCEQIKSEDLKSCDSSHSEKTLNPLDLLVGCAEGLFDSVTELLKFIWDVMKFAWSSATDGEFRGKQMEQASAYMESAKLYLNTEYEKAYEETSYPFREIKAMKKMGGSIAGLIVDLITQAVADEVEEFSCLNAKARSQYTCKLIGDIFLPPAAVLALIKKGPAAIKSIGSISTAFNKMKKKLKRGDRPDFPDGKDPKAMLDIDDDLLDLEKTLRAEGFSSELITYRQQMVKLLHGTPKGTPEQLKKLNDRAMVSLKRYFDEEGIPAVFTKVSDKNPTVEVQIDFSKVSDNPLYNKLKKYNEKLGDRKLKVSLQNLLELGGAGVYQPGLKQVKIGPDTLSKLIKGDNATTLTHEYRHSMFDLKREKGQESLFYGQLHRKADGANVSDVKGYENYISMEELYNHSTDTYEAIKGKKKLTADDWNFVKFKVDNVESMSKALYDNSKDLHAVGKSVRNGGAVTPDRPYTIVTGEGHQIHFTRDYNLNQNQIKIEFDGKVYVEPVVTAEQYSAFKKVVKGFQEYQKTGNVTDFNSVSMPRVNRLMEDIQDKSVKRARIGLYQYQWTQKTKKYMEGKTAETADIEIMKKATGILKQGVRENRKGFYDNKLLPGEKP